MFYYKIIEGVEILSYKHPNSEYYTVIAACSSIDVSKRGANLESVIFTKMLEGYIEYIKDNKPEGILVSEVSSSQLKYIKNFLKDYTYISKKERLHAIDYFLKSENSESSISKFATGILASTFKLKNGALRFAEKIKS